MSIMTEKEHKFNLVSTRKYPLRKYILGSRAPWTPGGFGGNPEDIFVTPKTYGSTLICDIL